MRTRCDASRLCILKTPCRPCRSFHGAKLPQWIGTTNVLGPCNSAGSICICRVIRKVPDAIESFQDVAAKLLLDRHHGVLLTGVALMMEICAVDPAAIEAYRKHVPQLCNIMRSLLMSGFAPEHDVSGITDPFLQVKVSLLTNRCSLRDLPVCK